MQPLVRYYLHQPGRGSDDNGIGPIYSTSPFLQRGHGIGNFLGGLFSFIKPMLWSAGKAVGQEALRAGGNILTDMAENKSPARDIVSRHVTASTQNLAQKLRGGGRKRKAASAKNHVRLKRPRLQNETSFPKHHQSQPSHVRGSRVYQF
jgi:hypothetical protein